MEWHGRQDWALLPQENPQPRAWPSYLCAQARPSPPRTGLERRRSKLGDGRGSRCPPGKQAPPLGPKLLSYTSYLDPSESAEENKTNRPWPEQAPKVELLLGPRRCLSEGINQEGGATQRLLLSGFPCSRGYTHFPPPINRLIF